MRSLGQALRQQLATRIALVRFPVVGVSGYLLYQATLILMYDSPLFWFLPAKDTSAAIIFFEHADVRFLITTVVASVLTLVVVFTGHNLWTFRDRPLDRKPLWMRFGQYAASLLMVTTLVTLAVNVLTVQFDINHFVALPMTIPLAGIWNWLWSSRLVWRRAKRKDAPS